MLLQTFPNAFLPISPNTSWIGICYHQMTYYYSELLCYFTNFVTSFLEDLFTCFLIFFPEGCLQISFIFKTWMWSQRERSHVRECQRTTSQVSTLVSSPLRQSLVQQDLTNRINWLTSETQEATYLWDPSTRITSAQHAQWTSNNWKWSKACSPPQRAWLHQLKQIQSSKKEYVVFFSLIVTQSWNALFHSTLEHLSIIQFPISSSILMRISVFWFLMTKVRRLLRIHIFFSHSKPTLSSTLFAWSSKNLSTIHSFLCCVNLMEAIISSSLGNHYSFWVEPQSSSVSQIGLYIY